MPNTIENERGERGATPSYDSRISANEARISVVEVDLAVIRTSFATKEDVQRILTLLYEHKLEIHDALAKQREDFHAAMFKQREDFTAALSKQREDFTAALSKQREDFNAVLAQVQIDLHKTLITHIWKLYGLASLVLGGVYYIARYVH